MNIAQDSGGRFIAILSGRLLGSEIIGVDVTYGIDGFNEAIRSTGYQWSVVHSGMVPRMIPLGVLRCEQDYIINNDEYVNRLLLVRI